MNAGQDNRRRLRKAAPVVALGLNLAFGLNLAMGLHSRALAAEEAAQRDPPGEVWLNPGFYAYHFQKNRNLNNNAAGLGAEYRWSPSDAVTAGFYRNGGRHTSRYVAYFWRPIAVGRVRFGAIVGAVDGYPGTRNGNWFPAALPALSVEYRRIGLNVFYIPSYGDSVNGSLTFQLNVKLF